MSNSKAWMYDIYITYRKTLFLYAFSLTKSKADAEDLVSETLTKTLVKYDFKNPNIEAWMFRVMKNCFLDKAKKNKRILDEGQYNLDWIEDPYDATENYIENENKRWMYSKIYKLPQRDRNIMLLSFTSNLDDEQIAELLGVKLNTIRTIRFRVKEKLIAEAKKERLL
ncbi:RNA polymerase sigma factor [Breznakia pachnodae]|uniref:RNA polymerase sigma-70 factor (ECF subfamily) n=1 Tax=Breznakia pachnodae TaxID=265178 RepID=A0ABU0E5M4_9FIRM|nr:sigma-70 family RNA polymerase sigma factor [Breznakia pachnodae]MDQ0362115.1 RNA polymerase sigma-70 factor (ECF subfamily) [Breznakia pachnodae]